MLADLLYRRITWDYLVLRPQPADQSLEHRTIFATRAPDVFAKLVSGVGPSQRLTTYTRSSGTYSNQFGGSASCGAAAGGSTRLPARPGAPCLQFDRRGYELAVCRVAVDDIHIPFSTDGSG